MLPDLKSHFECAARRPLSSEMMSTVISLNSKLAESAKTLTDSDMTVGPEDAVFYSGMMEDIGEELNTEAPDNYFRSKALARATGAMHIEDMALSKLGAKLLGEEYWFKMRKGRIPGVQSIPALKTVMRAARNTLGGLASERYAKMPIQKVFTAVCGAHNESVFVKTEFPAVLDNHKIKSINAIDKDLIRHANDDVSRDAAYDMVCQGELRLCYGQASRADPAASVWDDYAQRLLAYAFERQKSLTYPSASAAGQLQTRQELK